jgi:hypothetical protein
MKSNVSRSALMAVYAIAICADLIQICFVPVFLEGFASPVDDVCDVVVCVMLSWLIGFHVAFLPSFFIKLVPFAEIAPTWTIAVLIATRHLRAPVVDVPVVGGGKAEGPGQAPPKLLPDKNE